MTVFVTVAVRARLEAIQKELIEIQLAGFPDGTYEGCTLVLCCKSIDRILNANQRAGRGEWYHEPKQD